MNIQTPTRAQMTLLTMPDGARLATVDAPQANSCGLCGQVLLVHGLGEHMGRYSNVVQHLNAPLMR